MTVIFITKLNVWPSKLLVFSWWPTTTLYFLCNQKNFWTGPKL